MSIDFSLSCPIPISDYPTVQLAHGGGGRLMHQLIGKMFAPLFADPLLAQEHDGAVFAVPEGRLAMSTDSFVVRPLFFPGGNIGSLAIHGTVNDLAMCGARPRYLSASFVLEEGLPMTDLWRIVQSMAAAANEAGVQIVTGDTKVVDRGKGDGVYINTSGVGVVEHDRLIGPAAVQVGDAILINGDLGRHGIAIMAVREGLAFETAIESDSACVAGLVMDLLDAGIEIHCLPRHDARRAGQFAGGNRTELATTHPTGRTAHSRATGCTRRLRNPGAGSALRRQRRTLRGFRACGAGGALPLGDAVACAGPGRRRRGPRRPRGRWTGHHAQRHRGESDCRHVERGAVAAHLLRCAAGQSIRSIA